MASNDFDENELAHIGTSVNREAVEEVRSANAARRPLLFDPKNTYVSIAFLLVLLGVVWRFASVYGEEDRRLSKLEKQVWTKFHQSLWEQEVRQLNPSMKVPKTSEIDSEVDPLR